MITNEQEPPGPSRQLYRTPVRALGPNATRSGKIYNTTMPDNDSDSQGDGAGDSRETFTVTADTIRAMIYEANAEFQKNFIEQMSNFQKSILNHMSRIAPERTETHNIRNREVVAGAAPSGTTNSGIFGNINNNSSNTSRDSTRNANIADANVFTANTASTSEITFQPFWRFDPETWFNNLETQFVIRNIIRDDIKYYNLMKNLGPEIIRAVQPQIKSLPAENRYSTLKAEILRKYTETDDDKLSKFCQGIKCNDKRPSEFLNELYRLANGRIPKDTILAVWRNLLPKYIALFLDVDLNVNSEKRAIDRADHIYDLHRRNIKNVAVVTYEDPHYIDSLQNVECRSTELSPYDDTGQLLVLRRKRS